ncbi:hypothetical protein BGY98DRAFT_952296 [Russula aff. rugulosa BPL654]|nr:hypothetical protein BGY98DRAFT_952296 [Russula aff. rugulosa BPL654]
MVCPFFPPPYLASLRTTVQPQNRTPRPVLASPVSLDRPTSSQSIIIYAVSGYGVRSGQTPTPITVTKI